MEGEEILIGGKSDDSSLTIEPTVIDHAEYNHPIMQEEIFGPLLPVLEFRNLDDVVVEIQKHPKPLALYLFSQDHGTVKRVLRDVAYGGGCINDVVVQVATSQMPFGGVGSSGMGEYHGKDSFRTFRDVYKRQPECFILSNTHLPKPSSPTEPRNPQFIPIFAAAWIKIGVSPLGNGPANVPASQNVLFRSILMISTMSGPIVMISNPTFPVPFHEFLLSVLSLSYLSISG